MEKVLTIKCFDTCRYELVYPLWFQTATQASIRKMFKWLFQFGFHRENQDAISFLTDALPQLITETKQVWDKCWCRYEAEKQSLDKKSLPAEWTGRKKVQEIARRREQNNCLMRLVKDAKTTHEKTEKLLELFREAKAEWFR